jgi:Trk K+ transport system NAD-binding subunit
VDDEFYRGRARHIRELAAKADPFIRKRLLDLADNLRFHGEAISSRIYDGHRLHPPAERLG